MWHLSVSQSQCPDPAARPTETRPSNSMHVSRLFFVQIRKWRCLINLEKVVFGVRNCERNLYLCAYRGRESTRYDTRCIWRTVLLSLKKVVPLIIDEIFCRRNLSATVPGTAWSRSCLLAFCWESLLGRQIIVPAPAWMASFFSVDVGVTGFAVENSTRRQDRLTLESDRSLLCSNLQFFS